MYALRPPRFDQLMRSAAIGTRNAYFEHARKATGPMENWHVVGASDDPFDPDWRGHYYAPVRFRKDNEGFVYLVGRAFWFRNRANLRNRNWSYTFGPILTLPPGYRPQHRAYIGTQCRWRAYDYVYTYPSGYETVEEIPVHVVADFLIEPDGRVRPIFVNYSRAFDSVTVDFTSLAFRAAQPVL
jgi:hypothetical protein